jgi:P4 family phage/plasmid primase-like protien
MTEIFGKEAKAFYDAGIPVIPLHYHEKKPIPPGWNACAKTLPDKATQEQWIQNYPNGNIGLVLGEAAGLCAIDIDSADPKVIKAITDVLPPTEWVRVGQKGMMLLYKRNPKLKNRNIADENGEMVVEILCNSRQMVLPPSVHPKTKKPYTQNKHLLDALPNIVMLPDDIEDKIRANLGKVIKLAEGGNKYRPTEYISRGGRDNMMTHLAGRYAFDIRMGNLTVVEAIRFIENWAEVNVEKVVGDSIDIDKGIHSLAGFLIEDVRKDGKILPIGWDRDLSEEDKKKLGLVFGDDDEEWDFEQMIDFLKTKFETTSDNSTERREAITFILNKLARSPNPDALMESRLFKYIHKMNSDGVTSAAYEKELRKMRKGPIEGDNHFEIAEAAIEKYESREGLLRFWEGEFWVWRGDHWQEESQDKISGFIAKNFGSLAAAKKANDHKGIVDVMKKQLPQELTVDRPIGVNFINGFVDENLQIHDHHPDQGMTYVLPYRYIPENAGNFPKFNQLLHGYWSEDSDYGDKVRALQEGMCATVMGLGTRYQKAFLLYGLPSSGKSQLLNIIEELVPETMKSNMKPDMWKKEAAVVRMHDKLLNIAGELPENGYIPGDVFKEVVTGESVEGKFLYKNFFTFKPRAMHWFASNWLPKSRDFTDGFFRRWLVLDFQRVIPDDEKVLDFGKIIVKEEMEAIIAWALDAYKTFKDQTNYTIPKSHYDAVNKMQSMNSSVLDFFLNFKGLEAGPKSQCSAEELHKAYYNHVTGDYGKPYSYKRFVLEVSMMTPKARGFDIVERDGETWYVGIKPKTTS